MTNGRSVPLKASTHFVSASAALRARSSRLAVAILSAYRSAAVSRCEAARSTSGPVFPFLRSTLRLHTG
jgi:hypothetical protein